MYNNDIRNVDYAFRTPTGNKHVVIVYVLMVRVKGLNTSNVSEQTLVVVMWYKKRGWSGRPISFKMLFGTRLYARVSGLKFKLPTGNVLKIEDKADI